jgi:1-acyl-sn-glycerol-3-phosphate acyltransferase
MSDDLAPSEGRMRSAREREAFALPTDQLPFWPKATAIFGEVVVQCFTRVSVYGLDHVPTSGPLILAANHASNADGGLLMGFVMPALHRPVHWMGKAEALEWPVIGWWLRQIGIFGVYRGAADTEAFRLAKSMLDDGRVLGAFPEGTRSPTGALQTAREGVALLALRTGAPILPVGIAGSDRFWPKGQLVWGFGGRITVRVGEPFTLTRERGPDGRREPLENVTARLMGRIAALLPERQRGAYGQGAAGDASVSGDVDTAPEA